jgi:hypothetical protein
MIPENRCSRACLGHCSPLFMATSQSAVLRCTNYYTPVTSSQFRRTSASGDYHTATPRNECTRPQTNATGGCESRNAHGCVVNRPASTVAGVCDRCVRLGNRAGSACAFRTLDSVSSALDGFALSVANPWSLIRVCPGSGSLKFRSLVLYSVSEKDGQREANYERVEDDYRL